MAKFAIECPNCGKYAEGKTGFWIFGDKKIKCSCGYTINVKTDKLASRTCSHCGNDVVFDQTKGADALCPVCHEKINTMAENQQMAEFSCKQCGVRLMTSKSASVYTCPICDYENDVAERLTSEKIRSDGLASIIKYEGDDQTLVWKHPIEDFNYGSQLIVHESQEAVFFRDGQALDSFGAGRYTLETQQLPLLEKVYQLPTDTEGTFHSEVYYINLATVMGIKWGTDSKVRMFDPASGLHVELGASGEFNIRVVNSRKLLAKLVGTTGKLSQDQLLGIGNGKGYFRAMIMTQVKSYLAQTIKESGISVLEIDERLMELSENLRIKLNQYLDAYGLEMPEFFVSRVMTPDDDPNFRRMKEQYAEQYLNVKQEQIRRKEAEAAAERKAVEAQTAARMKIIGAQGEAEALKIQKQAEAEAYRMQAEAEAMEMKMKGYTYQQETARQVGMEAMKNGLTGGEGGGAGLGALGGVAGLGIGLGAMGSVIGMTKDALNPVGETASQMGQQFGQTMMGGNYTQGGSPSVPSQQSSQQGLDIWNCDACGCKNITSKFCPDCGAKKPVPKIMAESGTWTCPSCGAKGLTSKFCTECGAKRPEAEQPVTWTCTNCGASGITSMFCPECGAKKPESNPTTWNCPDCGATGITAKFCPDCGRKRD
ncbi:SPFH domain-containing protein [Oribacterium sp. FC2011]|uniref:SPFH domain-containing protein n=1 Tax=Oribacterium sp. FC2011 TaxID=1408311 RepID=UPI0004E1D116|nr:SPFH domain-containing protein [Oribacterium sp. FC2011]